MIDAVKTKLHMPKRNLFIVSFMSALLLSGCSLPKIIVLHDPLSADEHVRLGGIYDAQGKTELARDQYQAAVRQDTKHGKAWTLLGDSACRLKEYGEAEKAYGKALDLDPKNGDLHNNLAWIYVQQDRKLGKAQGLVMAAMELTPDHRPYYLDTLGVIQLKLGKIPDAIASLQGSTETIPRDQPDLLAEAYQHLADAYRAAGDIPAADDALERQRQLKSPAPKEQVLQP
jgi:Tfp pilus assembly protein PilF